MTASSLKTLLESHTAPSAEALALPEAEGALRCVACGHRCLVKPGRAGVCKVRYNEDGVLRVPWGYVAGLQVDPIEKKPFFHVYPGRDALSFGMLGCDLHCSYCQNWVTSQALRDDDAVAQPHFIAPEDLAALAQRHEAPVVVSTYNEPLITADWAARVFEEARDAGLRCGFVSNGNATPEVLEFLRPLVEFYKVDLKSFRDQNYRSLGCKLDTVLETIGRLKEMGFWVEIVTLVIPGFNDGQDELDEMARFIAGVSQEIPWHVTAFHPDYKMTDPPRTKSDQLLRAYDAGKTAGLHFVYPGNLPGAVDDKENTFCPGCDALLIERRGFLVIENRMRGSDCPDCGRAVPGHWEDAPPRESSGTGVPRSLRWGEPT